MFELLSGSCGSGTNSSLWALRVPKHCSQRLRWSFWLWHVFWGGLARCTLFLSFSSCILWLWRCYQLCVIPVFKSSFLTSRFSHFLFNMLHQLLIHFATKEINRPFLHSSNKVNTFLYISGYYLFILFRHLYLILVNIDPFSTVKTDQFWLVYYIRVKHEDKPLEIQDLVFKRVLGIGHLKEEKL